MRSRAAGRVACGSRPRRANSSHCRRRATPPASAPWPASSPPPSAVAAIIDRAPVRLDRESFVEREGRERTSDPEARRREAQIDWANSSVFLSISRARRPGRRTAWGRDPTCCSPADGTRGWTPPRSGPTSLSITPAAPLATARGKRKRDDDGEVEVKADESDRGSKVCANGERPMHTVTVS